MFLMIKSDIMIKQLAYFPKYILLLSHFVNGYVFTFWLKI